MWVLMIAFWGLLIWAVYALITNLARRQGPDQRSDERTSGARQILDERLARGEISPEEYQRLLSVISRESHAGSGAGSGK